MATFSTVLGLKLNDAADPFLLSDFIANLDILDANPGVFICTSTSKPSWGSAQAGRMIFTTDTKHLQYWTGTAWADLRDSAPVFAGGTYINTAMASGTTPAFPVLTFTTPRPCALAIVMTATYQAPNNRTQDVFQQIALDGTVQPMGNYREQIRFVGNSADAAATAGLNATSVTVAPSVTAGQHTLSLQVTVSNNYTTAVTLIGAKVLAFISLYSSGNSL